MANSVSRFLLGALLTLTLCLTGLVANAHEGRPVYIEATELAAQSANQYVLQLRWKVPPVVAVGGYPLIQLDEGQCELQTPKIVPSLQGSIRYLCPLDPVDKSPLRLVIRYPVDNPALSTLLRYQRLDGHEESSFTGPEQLQIDLPLNQPVAVVLAQYLSEGTGHILEGYDHLLFVFCLMVIAGTARRIVWAVTGFTVAHSITLGLASFDWLALRIDLVEMLIALSIVFLAAEATMGIKWGRVTTLTWRHPVVTSVGFGLLHGLGFASALAELGLPAEMKLTALLFFNIGVELGQLLFVISVSAIWWLTARVLTLKPHIHSAGIQWSVGFRPPSVMLSGAGILASFWFVERLFAVGVAQ